MNFWFDEAGSKRWFSKSDAFDAEVRRRFEAKAISLAASPFPHAWEDSPERSLALIIVLDQFPRNMYRDTKAAFAWDEYAIGIAKRMAQKGWDLKIPQDQRAFVYMPYMHSENLDMQDECVRLMDARLESENNLHHAKEHRKVIKRFGRFPHRNKILGRENTVEELAFLRDGGYAP